MSYKNLINSNLTRAFNLVKDLAENVVFVKRATSEFDFNALDLKSSEVTQTIIKTIIISTSKNSSADSGHNAKKQQIMLKTKDVGDITSYDHIVIRGEIWKIGPIIRDSGFVILAEISKEV